MEFRGNNHIAYFFVRITSYLLDSPTESVSFGEKASSRTLQDFALIPTQRAKTMANTVSAKILSRSEE